MRIRRPTSLTGIESQYHKLYKQIADDFGSGRLKWKEFDGSDFQAFRRRYSLTREDLGNLLGVSPVTIIRWETGRLRPSVQAVLAFNYLVHFQGQYFQGFADSTDHLNDIQQATESSKGDVVLPNDFHDHFSPAQIRLLLPITQQCPLPTVNPCVQVGHSIFYLDAPRVLGVPTLPNRGSSTCEQVQELVNLPG